MKTKKNIFEAIPYYYEKEKCTYVHHPTLSFVFVCQVVGKHPLPIPKTGRSGRSDC